VYSREPLSPALLYSRLVTSRFALGQAPGQDLGCDHESDPALACTTWGTDM
jgi:hypothetical protein